MAEAEANPVTETVINELGIRPDVEVEEEEGPVQSTLLSEPPIEMPPEEVAEEAPEAQAVEEATPELTPLEILQERMTPQVAEQDDLRRQIDELKLNQARYDGEREAQKSYLDQIIADKAPTELSEVEKRVNPAIAKMLADAPDDEQRLRIIATISDELAEEKVNARIAPLEERLNQSDQATQQRAQMDNQVNQIGQALITLRARGGTSAQLVDEFVQLSRTGQGNESALMRSWLQAPGIMTSTPHMVANAVGLATMVEESAAQPGTVAAPAATEQPRPVATDTGGTRPRASQRGAELTQPTPTEDPRDVVLGNLKQALRIGGGSLNDM